MRGPLQQKTSYRMPAFITAPLTALFLRTKVGIPFVSNITALHRTDGSGIVDIYYDLKERLGTAMVALDVSNTSGATWINVPNSSNLSGDVGEVTCGCGKHIVWNMGADLPGAYRPSTQFRVIAYNKAFKLNEEIAVMLPGDVPLVLVRIPRGTLMMGADSSEQDSDSDEKPQHGVVISQKFCIGKYPVTQAQWMALMGKWPGLPPSTAYGMGDMHPAYHISWDDAKDFTYALNAHITATEQEPMTVRLPSEAEWEYACRGTTMTRFPWGDDPKYKKVGRYAWYWDNSGGVAHEVGGKLANNFGLYDMSGNVFEWCEDDWHYDYTGAPNDGSAWVEEPRLSARVLRGGCWCSYFRDCRAAYRNCIKPKTRNYAFGFRISATPSE